jgi:hypothetical protein
MKVDMKTKLVDFSGNVMTDAEGNEFVAGLVCSNALIAEGEKSDKSPNGRESQYMLARAIRLDMDTDKETDLKSEQISKLKDLVSEFFPYMISGQVIALLEGSL